MRRWSAVRGPRGIDARIHTKLRVADVSLSAVEVTDETGGESLCRFTWEPGELAVGDRAYFTARGIQHVLDASADVLLRYRLEAVELCDGSGAVIDVLDAVEHLEIGETCDLDVIARLPDRTTAARLIAYRLPDDVVERARERLRREKRAELSARVFESAKYVLIFTTASRERLDAQRCLDGYRLRWQIELQFKRWKSLCGFDLLPNTRDDTTLAWLYAKVLLGALLDRDGLHPDRAFPPGAARGPRRRRARCRATPGSSRASSGPCCSPRCSRSSCMTPWHGYRTSFVGSAAWNRRDAELSASDSEGVNSSPGAVRR
jgi:hypothetical protein